MTIDDEVKNLIATIDRMAHRMNAVFVPDPQKIRDYKIALGRMRERRSAKSVTRI